MSSTKRRRLRGNINHKVVVAQWLVLEDILAKRTCAATAWRGGTASIIVLLGVGVTVGDFVVEFVAVSLNVLLNDGLLFVSDCTPVLDLGM